MSIHNDPRRNSRDKAEYAEWQNELRMEYRRESLPDDIAADDFKCGYMNDDGSCDCDRHCQHQKGKWKDMCALWKGEEK